LRLKKIWEVERAGSDIFASIRGISIADDGTVYVHDDKNLMFYIFSKEGKFRSAFGKKGEGPGEIRNMLQSVLYSVKNKVIALDSGKLHYFDLKGTFIKSTFSSRKGFPFTFLDENRFITAPLSSQDTNGSAAEIIIFDVFKQTETVITRFTPKAETAIQIAGGGKTRVQHPAVTAEIVIGHKDNHIFYGVNDKYKIHISDMRGQQISSFSLIRKKHILTEKIKFDELWRVARGRAPKEIVKKLAKKMSSKVNYFDKIEVNNGLIYVYNCYFDRKHIQTIDIFSLYGKYLYRGILSIPEDQKLVTEPVFKAGYFYLTIENEEGEQSVGKYTVSLPQK